MQVYLTKIIVLVLTLVLAACAAIDSDTLVTIAEGADKTSVFEAYAPVPNKLVVIYGALLLAIAIASKLSIFFCRQIVMPLQLLTQATIETNGGNLDTPVKLKHRNEWGGLATTFNQITAQLQALIQALQEERKQAEEQLRASAQRDRLLAEMALRIRNSLDLKQIFNTTVKEVRHFLQADRVFIMINNLCEDAYAQIVAESVAPNWRPIQQWIPRDEEHLREFRAFFAYERVKVIHDTASGELTPAIAQDCLKYQIRACLSIPIMLGDRIVALLAVSQCSGPRHWQPFEIDLLEKLGTQVAIAIQQAKLYQQVQALNSGLERQVEERTLQLQQKMQELQELYQTKDVFLHAFSHDLRTPIMGTALVLKNLLNQAEEKVTLPRSLLERMVQSSDRQLNLINSLLEAHSSEVQGIILHCEPVKLGQLIQRLVEDLEPLVTKNQATIINLVPEKLPLISIDPTQLSRVFENLITNALKHNPPGLSLTLNATLEDDSIRCTVADDGQGMSKQQCDRLFDLYYRGGDSRHFTGIGLGLYLCRQIIMAHGGEIGVISSLGAGTTFWFTFPLTVDTSLEEKLLCSPGFLK